MLDKLVIGTIKGTCSSPSQKHTTGAYRGSNNQCGIGTENLGVSLCLLEQTLVTPTAFNSVVRGERHWFFTVYSKNPGNLYDNVNGKTILARPTGKLLTTTRTTRHIRLAHTYADKAK